MGASPRRIKIVPCGVDLEHFTPHGAAETRHGDGVRIVTLSRLVPRKGIADVVEALAHVPNAELVVAGGGETAGPRRRSGSATARAPCDVRRRRRPRVSARPRRAR